MGDVITSMTSTFRLCTTSPFMALLKRQSARGLRRDLPGPGVQIEKTHEGQASAYGSNSVRVGLNCADTDLSTCPEQ